MVCADAATRSRLSATSVYKAGPTRTWYASSTGGLGEDFVLVTMDLTITEEFTGFDWDRYAIAWIAVREDLRGQAFEQAKQNIVHMHAHVIAEQRVGDHHTYSERRHSRSPPSLTTWLRRKL